MPLFIHRFAGGQVSARAPNSTPAAATAQPRRAGLL